MTTGQGTQSATKRGAQVGTGDDEGIGQTALRELRYLGGGLAGVGALLGVAGAAAGAAVVWAFGVGAAAVSLSLLAVSGYHGRGQSV